jgi:S1-C subfamily serine protease
MRTRLLLTVLAAAAIAGCGSDSGTKTVTVNADALAGAPAKADASASTALQQQFVQVIRRRSPAVVQIETSQGLGSGVVYDDRGNIVTNYHVVGTHKTFTVTLGTGGPHKATLVGAFPPSDLAVIRLDSGAPPPAPFADSSKVQVGHVVLAIGNPLGLRSSVTDGIVSSLGRTVPEGNGAVITSAVQTSAPINPGNSGGALVNLAGEVVGIPTLAAVDPELGGAQAPGIGFAIPSSTVKRIADQLIATGHVTASGRAFLGIQITTTLQAPGVLVAGVEAGGPADQAGIKKGDMITAVDGKPTPNTEALSTVLAELRPGQTVPVDVLHPDGSKATVKVKLGEQRG